jgi:hypothetical protein
MDRGRNASSIHYFPALDRLDPKIPVLVLAPSATIAQRTSTPQSGPAALFGAWKSMVIKSAPRSRLVEIDPPRGLGLDAEHESGTAGLQYGIAISLPTT